MKKQCFKLLWLLEVTSNLVLLGNEVPRATEGTVKSEIVTGPRSWRAGCASSAHALHFLGKRGRTESVSREALWLGGHLGGIIQATVSQHELLGHQTWDRKYESHISKMAPYHLHLLAFMPLHDSSHTT